MPQWLSADSLLRFSNSLRVIPQPLQELSAGRQGDGQILVAHRGIILPGEWVESDDDIRRWNVRKIGDAPREPCNGRFNPAVDGSISWILESERGDELAAPVAITSPVARSFASHRHRSRFRGKATASHYATANLALKGEPSP